MKIFLLGAIALYAVIYGYYWILHSMGICR